MTIGVVGPHQNVILITAEAEHPLLVEQIVPHILFTPRDELLRSKALKIRARFRF